MKPTDAQLERLRTCSPKDSEYYHRYFDELLEERLMELDPEWMQAMKDEYDNSGKRRWYA